MSSRSSLHGRHRNANGQISRKRGTTRVDTLRGIYGRGFAPGTRDEVRLSALLAESGAPSLSQYIGRAAELRRASRPVQWQLPLAA